MTYPLYLRLYLPFFGILFWLICFFWRALAHRRQTGKSPIVMDLRDTAHDYIWRMMFVCIGVAGVTVMATALFPLQVQWLKPYLFLHRPVLQIAGIVLSGVGLAICSTGQWQMGKNWRVGIDRDSKTELVLWGLYRFSRNPIYLGMTITSVALFLMIPSAITLLTLICGRLLMQIQVRLEEEYLRNQHGAAFDEYCNKVRRWI